MLSHSMNLSFAPYTELRSVLILEHIDSSRSFTIFYEKHLGYQKPKGFDVVIRVLPRTMSKTDFLGKGRIGWAPLQRRPRSFRNAEFGESLSSGSRPICCRAISVFLAITAIFGSRLWIVSLWVLPLCFMMNNCCCSKWRRIVIIINAFLPTAHPI